MSSDPHAPTPAGPDPDERTEVQPVVEPTPAAAGGDWLKPDADTSPATPAPDPLISTPSSFTPPGTPEDGSSSSSPKPADKAKELGEQAKTLTDKPEAMVGLAFLGGAVVSFVLKRFGR